MSRCIPFPPPGYVWNGVGGEALIELIKHNRERAEAEKERKKEKRRKKERRRKKENKKRREDGEVRQESLSPNCRHKDGRNRRSWEKSDNEKKRQYEAQGLENSSLTEELEQPMISDSQYDSSENSQNSMRKKPRWSPNGYNNHGSIIQFDFQQQKHKDQAALSGKPVCSTPTQMDIVVQEKFEMAPRLREDQFCSASGMSINIAQEMASRPSKEIRHSPSRTEVVADGKAETDPASSFSESGSLQIESQFRELIVNWVPVPPPFQTEHTMFDDQEWLFNKRPPRSDMTRKTNASNDDFCRGSCLLYPYACYLPKADIYAFPFTIPF